MALKLPKDTEKELLLSIKRYFREEMDQEVGDLKASLVLDFFLREIGPVVYNRGVADAQSWMQERLGDLDGSCHEPETGYWTERDRS